MSLLDKSNPALHLYLLPDPFQVLKYPPTTRIPQSIISNPDYTFLSLTRTPVELSIVYSSSSSSSPSPSSASSPSPTSKELDHSLIEELGKPEETGPEWRCIRVQGPMEHSMVGIMASLTAPLRDCQVSIFAISTWDTDYLLVPSLKVVDAVNALVADGWVFDQD